MVIHRKKNLLIFLIVVIIISFSPISLAGLTAWDITENIFFRGIGNGPITMHDQSSASKIQIVDGIVEFSNYSLLAGSIDFVGFNASSNANVTILAVGQEMIAYNIDANNGATTTTTVKVPSGTLDVDVEGDDSFSFNLITELVTVRELHGVDTKQIIIYLNRTSAREGEWVYYNLTSISVNIGTHDAGDVNSTLDIDADTFDVSETVGAPAWLISFNWTNVDPDASCLWVVVNSFYDGNLRHDIDLQLYNFTGTSWTTISLMADMTDYEWINASIYDLRIPNDYVDSSGAVLGRIIHEDPGNINHDIQIEFLKLHAFIPLEVTALTITITEDTFFWIFLAIVLSILTALLVWMKYGDSNN